MAGFTPINPPGERAKDSIASRQALAVVSEAQSIGKRKRSVASQYLGRDDHIPAVSVKKTSVSRQKRKVNTTDTATSKHRSSSNIDHDLHIHMLRGRDFSQVGKADSDQYATEHSKAKKATTCTKHLENGTPAVSSINVDQSADPPKSVSIYASATSMDALDSTSQRTSIEFVKANLGQSFTLYQGPASDLSCQSTVTFSQPQWTSALYHQADLQRRSLAIPSETVDEHDHSLNSCNGDIQTDSSESHALNDSAKWTDVTQDKPTNGQDADSDDLDESSSPQAMARETASCVEESERECNRSSVTPPPRARKHNMREVDEHENYSGLLLSEAEIRLLSKMRNAGQGKTKPIVRKPFPSTIMDRSSIFGASRSNVLRTCFRIGEALTFGAQAIRCNDNAILELYARTTLSIRDGRKQLFVFKDLYHDKPPYLEGTFELWNQARLWDLDSAPFLSAKGAGILSRVIARMKRDGPKWRLDVLSVWEATWEDVKCVAGICGADISEEDDS